MKKKINFCKLHLSIINNNKMKRTRENTQDDEQSKFSRYIYAATQQPIPIDCILSIFQFCNATQLAYVLPFVCTTWKNIIDDYNESLWKSLCVQYWPILKQVSQVTNTTFETNWKQLYLSRSDVENPYMILGMCSITILNLCVTL
jgi:hypothetical protein